VSDTCEHLAYEIDAATRIITVVYIGALTDDEVVAFYANLVEQHADAPTYDYLIDMRYTDWLATPEAIAGIDAVYSRIGSDYRRHIAIVRKNAATTNKLQETVLRDGLKDRVIRYFTDITLARNWLMERER
jgi:hypothetical protein